MPTASIWAEDLESGALPGICVKTGVTTEHRMPVTFIAAPGAAFILFGGIGHAATAFGYRPPPR